MKRLQCALKSTAKVAFSKATGIEKDSNEGWDAYEERIWRDKAHFDETEGSIIPPQMFKSSISAAIKYLNLKIPGERNSTFTKNFKGGVIFEDSINLNCKKDDLKGDWIFVPGNGVSGGGSRVNKKFPYVSSWEGSINVLVLDAKITTEVFEKVLSAAGLFIGLGFWRPANGGSNGRFEVLSVEEIN